MSERFDRDDQVGALRRQSLEVVVVGPQVKAAGFLDAPPLRFALGTGALRRAQRQAIVRAAKPAMQVEDGAAEAAARVDDARRLERPALSEVEGTGSAENPLVHDVGAGDLGIGRRQQTMDGERLISTTLPDPAGDALEP